MTAPLMDVNHWGRQGETWQVEVCAGPLPSKRVVPPAGEAFAFDVPQWKRRVTVYASRTGRSARVWVDGVEIKPLPPAGDNQEKQP